MIRLYTLCFCLLFCSFASATIVKPFENLGELVKSSDDVVIVTATEDLFYQSEYMTNFSWNLEVVKSFKNQFQTGESFVYNTLGSKSHQFQQSITGDLFLEVGQTYLLFMDQNEHGIWKPVALSFYSYEIFEKNQELYFVPTASSLELCTHGASDPLFVMKVREIEEKLETFISSGQTSHWDDNALKTQFEVLDFYPELRAAPVHCTSSADHPSNPLPHDCSGTSVVGIRWPMFPMGALPIHLDEETQVEYPNSHTIAATATAALNTAYAGINLTAPVGTTDYDPPCDGGTSSVLNSSTFQGFMQTLNGFDEIYILYNDPCEEITDLTACEGTLAIGGQFFDCSLQNGHDGDTYYRAVYGFVIFNDDMTTAGGAACQSDADFEIVTIHEITHALGLGHVDPADGSANMNPSCCNSIQALDVACMDHLYPVAAPVTWLNVSGESEKATNNIHWQTASEVNNDFYSIEYSTNGREFKEIGQVKGAGNTSDLSSYSFEDFQNLGSESFYRIKQVDFDGTFSYSEVISIKRRLSSDDVVIYPNPSFDEIYLIANLKDANVRIFNAIGKEQPLELSKISDLNAKIDLSSFEKGVYFLEIDAQGSKTIKSFIKS